MLLFREHARSYQPVFLCLFDNFHFLDVDTCIEILSFHIAHTGLASKPQGEKCEKEHLDETTLEFLDMPQ